MAMKHPEERAASAKQREHPREEDYPGPDLVGDPCLTCGLFSPSLALENGMGYCEKGYGWQHATRRPWACDDHTSEDTLQGLLLRLAYEIVWNKHARAWATGTNVGTPTNPMHACFDLRTKAGREGMARSTEETNAKHTAYVMAYGTGL